MTTPEPAGPWIDSPFFDELLAQRALPPEEAERVRSFARDGYLVVPDVLDAAAVARLRAEVEPLFADGVDDPRRSPNRFQDAWRDHSAVRATAALPRVLELLESLYGRRPIPFQTLNFRRGTEQRAHADTVHFHSLPRGFLCGVWIALEEVGPTNGTLFYYPGSHRLPEVGFDDLGLRVINYNRPGALESLTYQDYDRYEDFVERRMAAAGLVRTELVARPGTALIWAAGLVHGGGPIRDPASTRWSQVTHYFFEDCLFLAPIFSNFATGDLYLKQVTDVTTGERVTASYRGLPLPELPADGTYKLVLDVDAAGGDTVRLVSNYEIKRLADDNAYLRGFRDENANLRRAKEQLEAAIAAIERSPAHRLARLLTWPGRALKRLAGRG